MAAPIIAAVDPVTRDLGPARLGAIVAGTTGAELRVAGVYADDEVVGRLAGGQFGEDLRDGAGDVLDEATVVVGRDYDVRASGLALGASSAPRALEFAAQELGSALLVVGSAGHAAAGRVTPGSVARRVLDGSPCAVAIVPAGYEPSGPPATVGVGFVET